MSAFLIVPLLISATQANFDPQNRVPYKSLQVGLTLGKATYLELEPVKLKITLENRTLKPVKGHSHWPHGIALRVFVSEDGKPFYRFHPPWEPAGDPVGLGSIKMFSAGFKTTLEKTIWYKTRAGQAASVLIFPQLGTYKCRVRLRAQEGYVYSNTVDVKITRAVTEIDRAAVDALKTQDLDRFLAPEGRNYKANAEVISGLENFLRDHARSTYADYARVGLGAIHFHQGTPSGHPQGRWDKKALLKAVSTLAPTADKKSHPFSMDAAYFAGKAAYHARDYANARKYLGQAIVGASPQYARNAKRYLKLSNSHEKAMKALK